MDFTLKRYTNLLLALRNAGYEFLPLREMKNCLQGNDPDPKDKSLSAEDDRNKANDSKGEDDGHKVIYLRHDVDLLPDHSLKTATIEYRMGLKATYYFRAVPESWDADIISQIAAMGHEIGYHYESLSTCNGDKAKAYDDFKTNLDALRKIAGVSTICMHGCPKSKFDSRDLWKEYDYHSLGLKIEPYLDTDWSKVFYLTDTGRRWDGFKVSVRDRIPKWQSQWCSEGKVYHSSPDIIAAALCGTLPPVIMMTTHPQRWSEGHIEWLRELVLQNAKNIVKRFIVR